MATNAELLALFGDDFQDVLAGLQNLPAEARELLDRSMAKMLFDAEVFGSRVNKTVQGQRIAGISDDLIKAGLLEDCLLYTSPSPRDRQKCLRICKMVVGYLAK